MGCANDRAMRINEEKSQDLAMARLGGIREPEWSDAVLKGLW